MRFDTLTDVSNKEAVGLNRLKTLTMPGELFVAEGKSRWGLRSAGTISEVQISLVQASVGNAIIFTLYLDGNIPGIPFEVPAGQTEVTFTDLDITFIEGQYITVSIAQVGTTNPGKEAVMSFLYRTTATPQV